MYSSHSTAGHLGTIGGNFLYVCDTGKHNVVRLRRNNFNNTGANGFYSYANNRGTSGNGDFEFNSPVGVDVNGSDIYVADTGNDRIVKFDTSGTGPFNKCYSAVGTNFNEPEDICYSIPKNKIIVADTGNHRITKHDPDLSNPTAG